MNAERPAPPLQDPALYANRELSQLDFNFRVLAQAQDPSVPLLERLRYLCISCTNLDEFFEIRGGSVRHAIEFGLPPAADGLPPTALLNRIHDRAAELVAAQYRCFDQELRPALRERGIRLLQRGQWTDEQAAWLRAHFRDEIMPVLSPLALDPAHPFPKILNKSLNVVVLLEGRDAFGREGHMAIVRAPRSLPRIIRLPDADGDGDAFHDFVFLSSVLSAFVDELFPGMTVLGAHQFRVTRNSELIVDEDDVDNLALALRDELLGRGYLRAVRLEIDERCPPEVVRMLLDNFELPDNAVYKIDGPVNLSRVVQVYDLVHRPELKFRPFQPRLPRDVDAMFERIGQGDVLLHHPYDAFAPVLELIRQAAEDPSVLAIKQTLYRTGKDSPIVEHLIQAARNGKDVTVVVELRARFD
ncbi:MAG TPA: polyphosphate kinase 1, partial [Thermomonas sp.]|nr:polyphosphate kinase 1 [Thermomonas sp.]